MKLRNTLVLLTGLASALALAAGCSSTGSAGTPDASFGDASDSGKTKDAPSDHPKATDSGHPHDGGGEADGPTILDGGDAGDALDAGEDGAVDAADADAAIDAGPPTTLLVVGVTATDLAFAATFTGTSWSAASQIDGHSGVSAGGGVAFVGKGQAIDLAFNDQSFVLETLAWSSGAWGSAAEPGALGPAALIGQPVTAPGGGFAVHEASGAGTVTFDAFDSAMSIWTTQLTTVIGDQVTFPAVVVTASGDPMVLAATATDYEWSLGSLGGWGLSTPVPGVTLPSGVSFLNAGVTAVNLLGADEVVAGFVSSSGADPSVQVASITAATYSAGAWSGATTVATDVRVATSSTPVLAALGDGTLALAYPSTSGAAKVGFFDGTTWSDFTAVPGVSLGTDGQPLALTRGATGAVVELAFIDPTGKLNHTRLTDEASFAWSTPVVVDMGETYQSVSIASGY